MKESGSVLVIMVEAPQSSAVGAVCHVQDPETLRVLLKKYLLCRALSEFELLRLTSYFFV